MATVLIVDDSPEEREVIAAMVLASGRFEVETASTGEEALRRIERGGIDLLLTDFVMPGLDGLQLANRAVEVDPRLDGRIVIVTGGMIGREDALAFALRTTVLTKPFTLDQLLQTLESVLSDSLAQGA